MASKAKTSPEALLQAQIATVVDNIRAARGIIVSKGETIDLRGGGWKLNPAIKWEQDQMALLIRLLKAARGDTSESIEDELGRLLND